MKALSNDELLNLDIVDSVEYLRWFKLEMAKIKEKGNNKKHNKMEVKYKKQKALVEKYKECDLG